MSFGDAALDRRENGRAAGGDGCPLLPCQSMVQPPHWLPISSALLPATWMRGAFFESGSAFASFLSSTSDSRTACARHGAVLRRAEASSASCGRPTGRSVVHHAHGELDAQDARHRVIDARHRDLAFVDQRLQVVDNTRDSASGTITMSMPALIEMRICLFVSPA